MSAAQTMRSIDWAEPLVEPKRDAQLEAEFRRDLGYESPVLPYMMHCPWLLRATRLGKHHTWQLVHLDFELADLVALVVSQDNSCRYCFASQRMLMRLMGFPERRIRRLEQDLITADVPPRQLIALEFTRRLSRSNPAPGAADYQRLRDAGFETMQIKELTFITAAHNFWNRMSTLAALPPEPPEEMPDRWLSRLLRPLVTRRLERRRSHAKPESLTSAEREGPFAFVVNALDGLPAARALREVIDDAWRSQALTPRTRALIFAVVARGLGCDLSEAEAGRLLEKEGIDAAEFERILSHLASPQLDALESVIVPFARETIWYQPGPLQKRTRQLSDQFSTEQLMDLIATVSLANAVCRLSSATKVLE